MELTATAFQQVATNQNVLFTETVNCGPDSVVHRRGSGLITLRGITNGQCRARFKINFGANIDIPAGGTPGPISLAIAINGEPLESTRMIVTPAALNQFFNVNRELTVDVPRGCCAQISVRNTSGTNIGVQNASIIVERVA